MLQVLLLASLLSSPSSDIPTLGLPEASGEATVIVEFHEPPRLLSGTVAAHRELIQRLEADIARIETREGRAQTLAREGSVRFEYRIAISGASARVDAASIPQLRQLPYVRAVHKDYAVAAHLATSVPAIGAPQVWKDYGARGKGIVVAVIDTGIDYSHPALGNGIGDAHKVLGGYDFANDDADPMDDNGHGTHVAGIVAGNLSPIVGVAPDASLLGYKVLDAQGQGEASTVLAGIERALDPNGDGDPSDHADVVNMSLGGPVVPDDPLERAVERASAAGVVFAISAGNTNVNGSIGSPGRAPSAITVGATDREDVTAGFSSRGPLGGTWTAKPEIGAPGVAIASSFIEGKTMFGSGTSMAAPHIAGVAALIREVHPDWTPQDIKSAIVSTAKPVLVLGTGGGRVDAAAAIAATVLPSPANVSFGLHHTPGTAWSSRRVIRLVNRGSSPETLTVTPPVLPAGATLTADPQSLTIAPGATAELALTLSFGVEAPLPSEEQIALTGHVELTGSKATLRVPWLVVNGDVISVTYAGAEPFQMLITAASSPALIWQDGPRTYGAFAQYSTTVDVAILETSADKTPRLVIRERLPVNGYTTAVVSPDEAKHLWRVNSVDEHGTPFTTENSSSTILRELRLPSLMRLKVADLSGRRQLLISPFAQTQAKTYETVFAGDDRYFGMHRTVKKLSGDVTFSLKSTDWASQSISHHCRTACASSIGAGVGGFNAWPFFELPEGAGTWRLHMTPSAPDEEGFRAHLIVRETDHTPSRILRHRPWTYNSPALYNVEGRIAAAPLGRTTDADYYSRDSAAPVRIGFDGPPVEMLTVSKNKINVDSQGPLGETLGDAVLGLEVALYDANETALEMVEHFKGGYSVQTMAGLNRLDVRHPYRIAGRTGTVSQTSTLDARTIVPTAPSLTTLRVLDPDGVVVTTVDTGSKATLHFSARQSAYQGGGQVDIEHYPVNTAATAAWWRPAGTTDWQVLPVSPAGSDFRFHYENPGPPGDFFTADLGVATAAPGAIDLKIRLVDAQGGVTETIYEPVLVVTSTTRRRTVRP